MLNVPLEYMDFSTIDVNKLRRHTLYKKPATYTIDTRPGSANFLDAPGYPTHFLRNVYTQYGNDPKGEEILVINDPADVDTCYVVSQGYPRRSFRRLWVPLPEFHERVQLWEMQVYDYMHECYARPVGERNVSDCYILKYTKEREIIQDEGYQQYVFPDNALAILLIREFYPEHIPQEEWLAHGTGIGGAQHDWWNCYSEPLPVELQDMGSRTMRIINGKLVETGRNY